MQRLQTNHRKAVECSEVWQLLGAVKTQFGKFGDLLEGVQKKLQESANKIESAKTTSRQMQKLPISTLNREITIGVLQSL